MSRHSTIQMLSIAVMVLGLIGSGLLTIPIDRHRRRPGVMAGEQIDQTLPPWITLPTTALGSFRGLAVDVLWYRAGRLQEQGKYFEANQLAYVITSLQPRFPQVWSYQAWNMAYNISVATHTPEERWDWINKGIVLLRDRGIVYNPRAVRLYRELGWIFFHKFGKFMDDMHWYYRGQLAVQWQELLGTPPPDQTARQAIDQFRLIVDAPDTITQLVNQEPVVESVLMRLHQLGYKPDQILLRELGRLQMMAGLETARAADASAADGDETLKSVWQAIQTDPRQGQSVGPLLAYLRKTVLRDVYHMDPAFMLKLMERYGPMDWRHPVSHGCYWSELGVTMASAGPRSKLQRQEEVDLLNTNRQTIHAMQELARFGRVSLDPLTGRLDLMPDPRFIPAYERALEVAKRRIEDGALGSVRSEGFDLGHENFLLEAMTIHYLYGDTAQANEYYKKARRLYGDKAHNRTGERYNKPISAFVTGQLRDNLDMMANTSQFIRAMLRRAFDRGLAYNLPAVFDRFVELARVAHDQYQKDKLRGLATPQGRLALLPFDNLLVETYLSYMHSVENSLLKRSRVWAHTPLTLKQRVSDRLLPVLHQQAQKSGFAPGRMFPAPATAPSRGHERQQPAVRRAPVQIERQ